MSCLQSRVSVYNVMFTIQGLNVQCHVYNPGFQCTISYLQSRVSLYNVMFTIQGLSVQCHDDNPGSQCTMYNKGSRSLDVHFKMSAKRCPSRSHLPALFYFATCVIISAQSHIPMHNRFSLDLILNLEPLKLIWRSLIHLLNLKQ